MNSIYANRVWYTAGSYIKSAVINIGILVSAVALVYKLLG